MTNKKPTKGIIATVIPDSDLPTNLQGEKADIVIMPEALHRRGLLAPTLAQTLDGLKPLVIGTMQAELSDARRAAIELLHRKDGMDGMLLEAKAVLEKSVAPEATAMLEELQKTIIRPEDQFTRDMDVMQLYPETVESTHASLSTIKGIGADYDGDITCGNVVRVVSRIKKGPGKGRLVRRKLYKGFKLVWGAEAMYSVGPLSDLSVDMTQLLLTSHLKPERVAMFGPHVEQTVMRQGDEE